MKGALVLLSVFAAVLFSAPVEANWWEKATGSNGLDQQSVTRNAQGPLETAVRVNWVDDYIEVMAGGTVDSAQAVNMAHALAMAKKTARHLAYEKLAETIHGIHITADATYDRELMLDSNLQTAVEALIRGAQVIDESHVQLADGSLWATVRLGLHITGPDSLMSSSRSWFEGQQRQALQPAAAPGQLPENAAPEPDAEAGPVTGLIIDAGGLGVKPAMVPRIYSESGEILFGPQHVDNNYLVRYGMAGYAGSVDQARANERVGDDPLVISAQKAKGAHQSDVVISAEDAAGLLRSHADSPFLKECRVVFVVN